jgi:hypothetical protein
MRRRDGAQDEQNIKDLRVGGGAWQGNRVEGHCDLFDRSLRPTTMIGALACGLDLPASFRILKPLRDPGYWHQERPVTFSSSYRHQHHRVSYTAQFPDQCSVTSKMLKVK